MNSEALNEGFCSIWFYYYETSFCFIWVEPDDDIFSTFMLNLGFASSVFLKRFNKPEIMPVLFDLYSGAFSD